MLPGQDGAFRLRRANTADTAAYIAAEDLTPLRELQPVSRGEAMFETVMLSLRTLRGIELPSFRALYGEDFADRFGDAAQELLRDGLALEADGCFRLTDRGLSLQNQVLMRFMNEN